VPLVLGLGVGLWGLPISFVTALVSSYRARWFFWWSLSFAVVYAFLFPIGTLIALPFVIFLAVKRREFFAPRNETSDAIASA
jgi:hypothetical protein